MSNSLRVVICLFSLLGLTPALAADRYIAPDGNDSGSGTLAQPWLTFAHATRELTTGDTLHLRGGIYAERLILTGKSGAPGTPIIIRTFEGEAAVIDGDTLTVPPGGRSGLVVLENCNHLQLQGIEIRNFVTAAHDRTPAGIQIEGSGTGLEVRDCTIHHIWQSSNNGNANGFGISVYGTSSSPINELVLDGNEIYDLRTGLSESVVLNGNVTNFTVSRNHVHDCNNIGIDFIGYEGSAPAEVDRARDGVCRENLVHDIDSSFNPGYGGNFTNGGGERSAAGIYVDGGTNITIERNHVYACDFGIELASEHATGFTNEIRMFNNLLHHNLGPGLIMGGYDSNRGKTRLCEVRNNTLYRNDTLLTYGGQIALQFYLEENVFKNNIVWASPTTKQMVVHYVEGGNATKRAFPPGNVFDYNIYFCEGDADGIEFGLNPDGTGNQSYSGLPAWRAAVGSDANSIFLNPGFATAVPSVRASADDFKLVTESGAVDIGEPSPPYVPDSEEKDFFGRSRVATSRVDVGFNEYMTELQAWRDSYFGLPDGGSGADDDDDPDRDRVVNLIEYSQGMNPLVSDPGLAPSGEISSGVFRLTYRKQATELNYDVHTSSTLLTWPLTTAPEQSDGEGLYWRDFPLGTDPFFARLKVTP